MRTFGGAVRTRYHAGIRFSAVVAGRRADADSGGETEKHGNGVSRSRKPLLMTLKGTLWQQ